MKRERQALPEERAIALRPGLWGGRHTRDGVDGYLIYDPLTHRQEFFQGDSAQALWELGAGRKPSSLPAPLVAAARELWRKGLLALALQEAPERPKAITPTLPFTPRPSATFSCLGCGLCCRAFHDIGPVQEREKPQIISAARLIERTRRRSEGEILQLSPPEDPSEYWPYQVATQKGRCLFLNPDSRCAIHEKVGASQKPLVCRAFPLQLSMIGGQARMIASSRCPSVALTKGAPLSSEEGEALWREGATLLSPKEPSCGWEAYREAESFLLRSLESPDLETNEQRRALFEAFLARLGLKMPPSLEMGRFYSLAKRLELESHQKGGEPLAAASWGLRWCLGYHQKSPLRPWQSAFSHSQATRGRGEALRGYLADQVFSGEMLQYNTLPEGAWRLSLRAFLIDGHAKALVQAGLSKEPYATAEAIYLWDFATISEAWQILTPGKASEA